MKVRAVFGVPTQFGFYGNKRRYDGDEFSIDDESELGRWMEVVEEKKAKKPGPKPKEAGAL